MPLVQAFSNTKIYIHAWPAEHPPPHFHIIGPDLNVSVRIDTLEIMAGKYRPKDIVEAWTWAAEHVDLLMETWEKYNARD